MLEKYGHTEAHEVIKRLSQKALASNIHLTEAIRKDNQLAAYWQKFTDKQKLLIEEPENRYTGLASQRAFAIHRQWSKLLAK